MSLGNAGLREFIVYNTSNLIFPNAGAIPVQTLTKNSTAFFGQKFNSAQVAKFIAADDIVCTLVFLVFCICLLFMHRFVVHCIVRGDSSVRAVR